MSGTALMIAAAALMGGTAAGYLVCAALYRRAQRKARAKRSRQKETPKKNRPPNHVLRSVTRLIFVTTQVSALVWVFTSYAIAVYSTVRLGQVYTMAELSEPAIHTILGVGFLKVLENIFEHNEGPVFGRSMDTEGKTETGGGPELEQDGPADGGGAG